MADTPSCATVPQTIGDLTRAELLMLVREYLIANVRRLDLIWIRHGTLQAEAHRAERVAQEAHDAWFSAFERGREAFDAAQALALAPAPADRKWRHARAAWIAAQAATLEAERQRDAAEEKAKRARKRMEACWAAWEKEAGQ